MEAFNKLPDVYIFSYDHCSPSFPGLCYSITNLNVKHGNYIEQFNTDVVGTLLDLKNGEFIRRGLEYNMDDVLVYKNTVIEFCSFIKDKQIPNLLDIDIVNLCNSILRCSTMNIVIPKDYVNYGLTEFGILEHGKKITHNVLKISGFTKRIIRPFKKLVK